MTCTSMLWSWAAAWRAHLNNCNCPPWGQTLDETHHQLCQLNFSSISALPATFPSKVSIYISVLYRLWTLFRQFLRCLWSYYVAFLLQTLQKFLSGIYYIIGASILMSNYHYKAWVYNIYFLGHLFFQRNKISLIVDSHHWDINFSITFLHHMNHGLGCDAEN